MLYTYSYEGDILKKGLLSKIKKKTLKKLIIVGLILLFFLLIILGVVCVKKIRGMSSNIDITIKTLDTLEVSADGVNYRNKLTKDDLNIDSKVYKNRNQLPNVLTRVSTGGMINEGKLELFQETIKSKGKKNLVSSEELKDTKCYEKECKDNNYIVYDLFFQSDAPETIALTPNSYVKQKKDNGLENAIRVGFVVEGTTSSKEKEDIHNLSAGIKAIIWEPNSDIHTKKAIEFAKEVYDVDINDKTLYYRGISNEFKDMNLKDIDDSNNYSNISSDIVTKKDFNTDEMLFTIQQGVTKVRVYIWLESNDQDAMFEEKVTNLDINLEFKTI